MRRAALAGISRILAVGEDLSSSRKAVELANAYDAVYAAVGVHPHHADAFEREAKDVQALTDLPKVVAIGEIGLDYDRSRSPVPEQLEAFREQLIWARERNLPVSVHNRAADADVASELRQSHARAVLHCFSGSAEFAAEAVGAGWYLSFAGNLTFPRSEGLREVARRVPLDRVLLESDAPVLAPQPWRGRRNEPAYIWATAETLARLLDIPVTTLEQAESNNAAKVFGWSEA